MKLTHIHIACFRAIRKADIAVGNEVALVGQNSAGKTSILRALNAFFNFEDERIAFESGQHTFQASSFAVIELTFTEVPATSTLPRTSAADEVRARLRFRKQAQWQIFDGHTWVAAPLDLHALLRQHISFAFIPLRRDHEIAGWGPGGLMERVVEASVRATRQRDHITPGIRALGERLQKQSLNTLATQLRKKTPLRGNFEYTLDYAIAPDYSVLLRNLILHVREGSQTVSLADSGSGTQSLAVFALYSYLAEIENSTYILGFEEPEQNLHPQAQIQLLTKLKSFGLQVIFTTHSPTMIDALDHEQVVLCRRAASATRAIETQVTQLPSSFFASRSLNRDDYYRFHRRRNSEFFFADHVVVTESPIDAAVVGQMMADSGTDLASSSVSVLPLDGVGSLSYVFHLLRALDIKSTFIVDKDYFLPYVNNYRDTSLDAHGYPRFGKTLKHATVVDWIFPRSVDKSRLERNLFSDHAAAAAMLQSVGFHCFRWSLEVDLVSSPSTRTKLYAAMNVPPQLQSEYELLVTRKKTLKKQTTLINGIDGVPARGLPIAYKGIRRELMRVTDEILHA
ncbi:AAA family ATPase [Glaciihabitans sp. INWT7]|uniref:ATP-dependent nuclease n=1 Tax=Glaciihabitans sp. INWT7 TaxID=2596912 RepID=UPI00162608BC|nr:AAA family ATPase [Glaciihabitans sp. INWT7]QNE45871.1 AAA family ATPase [Glaciihabitans sp. INWT7]